jgi:hypothetical protein
MNNLNPNIMNVLLKVPPLLCSEVTPYSVYGCITKNRWFYVTNEIVYYSVPKGWNIIKVSDISEYRDGDFIFSHVTKDKKVFYLFDSREKLVTKLKSLRHRVYRHPSRG